MKIAAVDATPVGEGACRVRLASSLARAVYRRSELEAEHARRNWPPWGDPFSELIRRPGCRPVGQLFRLASLAAV